MALFLGLLGGAAAVEIHRAITKNFDENQRRPSSPSGSDDATLILKQQRLEMVALIDALKRKESQLSSSIAAIEEELAEEKASHVSDKGRMERVCAQLKCQLVEAEEEHRAVCAAYNSVKDSLAKAQKANESLSEEKEQLELLHKSLLEENSMLITQFERLKTKHEEETKVLTRRIEALQDRVSQIVTRYVWENSMSVEEVVQALREIGVEMDDKERVVLEEGMKKKRGKERARAVEGMQVVVEEDGFFDRIHVMNSPTRAATLFFKERESSKPTDPEKAAAEGDKIAAVHASKGNTTTKAAVATVAKGRSAGRKVVVPVSRKDSGVAMAV
jgi:hypothetical protein